jgi:LacI family transcriptional regulator
LAKKITMTDIGKLAGVSQTTVSIVLNDSKLVTIADETRKRVLDAAMELGYIPSPFKNIPTTKKIAVLINELNEYDPFMSAVKNLREHLTAHGYMVAYFETLNNRDQETLLLNEIRFHGYAGLIYCSSMLRELPPDTQDMGLPTVMLNYFGNDYLLVPSIIPAEESAAYKVVSHLIENGCRKIGFITGESWMEANRRRLAGVERALTRAGLTLDPDCIFEGAWRIDRSYQATKTLLDQNKDLDAIFCFSDEMTLGCYMALKERGIEIGKDIAVASNDNRSFAKDLSPTLTSIELPYGEMGIKAAQLLLNIINTQESDIQEISVFGSLSIGESSQLSRGIA